MCALSLVHTLPSFEKTLSVGALEAGTANTKRATFANSGNCFLSSLHQSSGLPVFKLFASVAIDAIQQPRDKTELMPSPVTRSPSRPILDYSVPIDVNSCNLSLTRETAVQTLHTTL